MNKLFSLLLVSLLAAAGCAKEDEILPKQQQQIVSFLTGSHVPRLISEAQIAQEGELPFYSTSGTSVYRYINDAWNTERLNRPAVGKSSTVTITYRAYVFAYRTIPETLTADAIPFDSNDPSIEQELYTKWGLTPGVWSFEPMRIDLGKDEILKGLRLALIGCREGDRVEAYMTYNMAYGAKFFNVVPRDTPVAYLFTVDRVE